MSRIGKLPIPVPNGVEVKIGTDVVEVKGPKGSLSTPLCSLLKYELADGHVTLTRLEETRESRSQHGLRRTLLANCIDGVTKGFSKALEVIGVGYRVAVKGNIIELAVGFSHPVVLELPAGIKAAVMEAVGVRDVLAKAIGTNNPHNVLRATIQGLVSLRSAEDVSVLRGKKLEAPRK